MPKIEPFEKYAQQYDDWFEKNQDIYLLELEAIKGLIPEGKLGIELGVGTGRFAEPLGIKLGIDPSYNMAELARDHGIQVCNAIAENLPFNNSTFNFVLMVTTICFLDDVKRSFKETNRILKPNGDFIIGFIDKESDLGKSYELRSKRSKFYKDATFYSVKEVIGYLSSVNFQDFIIKQTVFSDRSIKMDQLENGYGSGCFVIIKTKKEGTLKENQK